MPPLPIEHCGHMMADYKAPGALLSYWAEEGVYLELDNADGEPVLASVAKIEG